MATKEKIQIVDSTGKPSGLVIKYYEHGTMHYKSLVFINKNLTISAVFYSMENARAYIKHIRSQHGIR